MPFKGLELRFLSLILLSISVFIISKKESVGLVQNVGMNKKIELNRDQVIHLIYCKLGAEYKGTSILHSCAKLINYLMNIDYGIAQAVYRHGFPQFDISVGDESNPATKQMIDGVTTEVEDLNVAKEIFMFCINQIVIDEETGVPDFSRTTSRMPLSKRGKMEYAARS